MVDRMTLNFGNEQELKLSAEIRKLAGARGVNRLLKEIIRQWLEKEGSKNS